jgi:hypothetical protein
VKGALNDPLFEQDLSPSGLSTADELRAQMIDLLAQLQDLTLRANFEEPKRGWPAVYHVTRPAEARAEAERKETEEPKSEALEIAKFTNQGAWRSEE